MIVVTRHRATTMYRDIEFIRGFQNQAADAPTVEKIQKNYYSYTGSFQSYNLSVSEPQQQGEKSVHAYCCHC